MRRFSRAAWLSHAILVIAAASASARDTQTADIPIDPGHFREDLAARAIFEESNRQRLAAGLPGLSSLPAAQTAAKWQAQFMAQTGSISHVNTIDRNRRNVEDRARAAGIGSYRFLAENAAMNFAVAYEAHRPFFTRPGPNGAPIFSYSISGPPIGFQTYAGLARAVVAQWLNSPGHRRNLLSREAHFLGCAAAPGLRDLSHGLGNIYCAQVFVALR
jgi:uncharacterized protein YkwD